MIWYGTHHLFVRGGLPRQRVGGPRLRHRPPRRLSRSHTNVLDLDKPPTHVDGPEEEQFSWELERCCELALQANPTVLECLWSPLTELVTDTGRELLALRGAFLSARVAQSYGGYAQDQFKRLEAARRKTDTTSGSRPYTVRLLMAGAHVLGTGQILVDVANKAKRLAIKHGEWSWDEVRAWDPARSRPGARAAATTCGPPSLDCAAINDFLSGPAVTRSDRSRPGFGPAAAEQRFPLVFATVSGAHLDRLRLDRLRRRPARGAPAARQRGGRPATGPGNVAAHGDSRRRRARPGHP